MAQQSQGKVQLFGDNDFGDKVAFTVGSSYFFGFLIGLVKGTRQGWPKNYKMPRKLIMNNLFNSIGRETGRFGNGFAAAGLMYYLIGGAMNMLLEDQLEDVRPLYKNIMCGGATGMLLKSTLGFVPCAVGGVLGASLIGASTLLIEEGNRRGKVAFEMKF